MCWWFFRWLCRICERLHNDRSSLPAVQRIGGHKCRKVCHGLGWFRIYYNIGLFKMCSCWIWGISTHKYRVKGGLNACKLCHYMIKGLLDNYKWGCGPFCVSLLANSCLKGLSEAWFCILFSIMDFLRLRLTHGMKCCTQKLGHHSLRYVFNFYSVRGEIDQISTNTFRYTICCAPNVYVFVCILIGAPVVPLKCWIFENLLVAVAQNPYIRAWGK